METPTKNACFIFKCLIFQHIKVLQIENINILEKLVVFVL